MKNSGIYIITCTKNNNRYIGSSRNMQKRKWDHWHHLKAQCHHNKHMQAVYNKYGKDSLKFEILEIVSYDKLIEREQFWIDKLNPEINKSETATSGFLGRKHTKESKMKMSLSHKKRLKNSEVRERLRQAAIEQHKRQPNGMKGKKQSDEIKEHLRQKALEQFSTKEAREKHSQVMSEWMTDEIKQRISESKRGHKQSKETKKKRSKSLKKAWSQYTPQERNRRIKNITEGATKALAKHHGDIVSPDGIVYKNVYNLAEFCRKHGLSNAKMTLVKQGKNKSHKGWRFL